ncbi:ATP-binding protein [bacterium]|nr:ATP-binding protein [bacterium]
MEQQKIVSGQFMSRGAPVSDRAGGDEMLSIRMEEYEHLSQAFQKFSEASMLLQSRYTELKEESQTLRLELEKKEAEIKRGERLATLGETAAALAHEIRNPLGAISLYTSLLKDDLSGQPEQQELVVAIDRGITTLNHVVSNILHFAKSTTPPFAPISLESLLREVCSEFQEVHSESTIRCCLRGNLRILGDETALRQLFSNLILNALQAQQLRGFVAIVAYGTEDGVRVKIRDHGEGIPSDHIQQIFDPFMTSKPEGTGLGLAICKEIAKTHGAELSAQNRRNGAQFLISFSRQISSVQRRKYATTPLARESSQNEVFEEEKIHG